MNTYQTPRQGAPELALRLRIAATILTRAACLVATERRLKSGISILDLSMSGILGVAKRELYPDPRTRRRDGEPDEAAYCWARVLVWQEPINDTPTARDLIRAAMKLREWAERESAGDRWRVAERRVA